MYMLNQVALVHWHGFEICTHQFKGMTAILGGNTAGKSTLIDAISLALGGASTKYVELNAAASEEKSKERSIGGYILGQTSQKTIMRKAATCYVALTFEHSIDPSKPSVTLGFRASASEGPVLGGRGSDRTDTKELFLFVGPKLVAEDYCLFEGDEGEELSLHQLEHLILEKGGSFFNYSGANQSLSFIRDSWRHLSSQRHLISTEHARQWVKSMRRAMAFTTSDNPGEFISEFLLEKKDIETEELTESIDTYRKLHKDVTSLKTRAKALEPILDQLATHKELYERIELHETSIPLMTYWHAKASYSWNAQRLHLLEEELKATDQEIESVQEQIKHIEDDIDDLKKARSSLSEASHIEKLETRLQKLEFEQRQAYAELQDVQQLLNSARDAYRYLDKLTGHPELYRSIRALADFHVKHDGPAWVDHIETIAPHLERCADTFKSTADKIALEGGDARSKREALLKAKATLADKVKDLDSGTIPVSHTVRAFLEDLNARGVSARLVRDSVDISMPEWQPSVEAVLAGDREAVVVEPDDYERALDVLKSKIEKYGSASLVNTVRLSKYPPKPAKPGSLLDAVTADNEYVSAFLTLRLGQVMRTTTSRELKGTRRGVLQTETIEGINVTFDDGVICRNRRVPPFVLGSGAIEMQLAAARTELRKTEAELMTVKEDVSDYDALAIAFNGMAAGVEKADRLTQLADRYRKASADRNEANSLLQRYVEKVDPQMQEEFDRLDKEKAQAKINEGECKDRRARVNAKLDAAKRVVNSNEIGGRLRLVAAESQMQKKLLGTEKLFSNWRAALTLLKEHYTRDAGRLVPVCRSWEDKPPRQQMSREKALEGMKAAQQDCQSNAVALAQRIKFDTNDYYRHFNIFEDRPSNLDQIFGKDGVAVHVEEEYARLTGTRLHEAEDNLREASEQIQGIIQGRFLTELGSRLSDARSKVDKLTAALRNRPLHNERYRFKTLYAPGRHEDLARLADAVCRDDGTSEPVDLPLFGETLDEDHPHRTALLELRKILDDPTEDFSAYRDYTNYLKFDLEYENLETGERIPYAARKGSGSGAEKGVPWYVAIGASLAALYHSHHERTSPGLGFGLVIFDEAFAKLDGPNQAILMTFFEDLGLQVILGAPDDRRITVMSYIHTILYVSKHRNKASGNVVQINDYLREMLRNINPDMLTDDMLRHVCTTVDISDVDSKDKDALVGALLKVKDAALAERSERLAMDANDDDDDGFLEEAV